uniref:Uncharacterized protein n=1 Tax=Salix viminalis TaxID=40686 RepID=A0A6N2MF98_SALVM
MTSKILAQLNDKMKELPSEQNRARCKTGSLHSTADFNSDGLPFSPEPVVACLHCSGD